MPEDLPIYSETMLRSGLQFAGLARLQGLDTAPAWMKGDRFIAAMEGATDVTGARTSLKGLSKDSLLRSHSMLFEDRAGAGQFRTTELRPLYRGQDCAPPQFIERSLENFETWLGADSFSEIHPIERCALTIVRIVDIWPFEFGNLTAAVVFGNVFLEAAAWTPFFVQPENMKEFEKAIAQSMTIEMQPLINAIYNTVKREMELLARP